MGKYDIDAKLTEECKLTLADLIQELMEERKDVKKGGLSEGAYRQAFNNKKSGLIPKIKKATGIDLDIYIKGKNLILYGRKNLSAEEIKKYRYAVKNVWTLMEIIREDGNISGDKDIRRYVDEIMYGRLEKCKQKQIDIFISSAKGLVRQDILEGQIFIALVQEIFFVSYNPFDRGRKEEKIDISYYGYTNKTQTLSSVLKKENVKYQSPIAVLAWVRRIESRSLINNGVPKKVLMKRKEVEKKILDIQRELYNNQTITVFDFFSNDVINHLEYIFSN